MAKYKISGVWKDANRTITHYAVHTVNANGITRGEKMTKVEAVKLLSNSSNEAMTWLWDYSTAFWKDGAKVEVVGGSYLRSHHDGTLKDNLSHLINYGWL